MTDDPMQVVFALLGARRRHSIDDVSALLHPGVIHEGVTDELVCHGRDQVLENVRRSFQQDDEGLVHLELVLAGEEHVILGLAGPRFAEAPWAAHADHIFIVHTVRDGRVTRMRDFLDRAAAYRAAGTTPAEWS